MIGVLRLFGCMIGVILVTLYWSSLTSLFFVILNFKGTMMDKDLMDHLQRINSKLSFYEWHLDYGGLDAEAKKVIQERIENLRDKKSSLNGFRLI
jgi:hypothetical protein